MDYIELENLWKQYDTKLDNLEKLNKKLMVETLARKPQKRLNRFMFNNYYGLIMTPVILLVALHDFFFTNNIDTLFIIGCCLILGVIFYNVRYYIMAISILKKVNIINDTVVESATKISKFKMLYISVMKSPYIAGPILLAGILFIGWDHFKFDTGTIIFIIILLTFMFITGKIKTKRYQQKIDKLLIDINELKEYKG